jgi:crossover junction endodeoxyribonuclease RuvC
MNSDSQRPAVFGLDLSLTSTGLSGCNEIVSLRTASRGAQRLDELWTLIREHLVRAHRPSVVVEGYSYASRNSQAHSIGELGGVVRVELYRLGIPYVEVAPTARAKFATGKGNAGKGEVLSAVSARTGIVWSGSGSDDMCDAWILQEMGFCALGVPRFDWPETNRESLKKIDWQALNEYYGK